jgi:hypothetical protein
MDCLLFLQHPSTTMICCFLRISVMSIFPNVIDQAKNANLIETLFHQVLQRKRLLLLKYLGEITLYPPEVSTHFHFCLQSLKCDTLPPQTFKLWQFNPFDLFIPKIPPAQFFQKKKKKNPKNKKRVASHHLWGGSATPAYIYIFFWVFFFFWNFFF